MRKKKLMALSLVLVIIQIVSLLAIVPVSAANQNYYAIYKTNTAPTVDGNNDKANESWDKVSWSGGFTKTAGDNATTGFSAKFKMMWSESSRVIDEVETDTIDLWYYVEVTDTSTTYTDDSNAWKNDYFSLSIAFGGATIYNAKVTIDGSWPTNNTTFDYVDASYKCVDNRTTGGYTIEYKVSIPADKISSKFNFDIMVNDRTSGGNGYSRNAWCSMNDHKFASPIGIGCLSNISVNVANKVVLNPYNSADKEYTFYKAETAPTDSAVWNNYEWSEAFHQTGGSANNDFGAKFKALWFDNTANETVDLYFYLYVTDATTTEAKTIGGTDYTGKSYWTNDYFTISIDTNRDGDDNDSGEIDSNFRGEINLRNSISRNFTVTWDDQRASNGHYTVTLCVPIAKTLISDNKFNFDFMVNNCGAETSNVYTRMAWIGMNDTGAVGIGTGILSQYASPADEPISTEAGAGTRLTDPAGLRFESRINKAKYDALVDAGAEITTGTLIVPTDYLTEYGINNSNFTKANLDVLKVEYLDVVNNGWVNSTSADTDGYYKYYGSIVGIKTANLDRNFSGIGYMTVKTATEEYTVYGGYRAADHARSVQYVAAAAIASGEYNDYLTTLQSFIKDSAPAKADGTTYRIMQYNLLRDNPAEYPEQEWGGSSLEVPNLKSSVRKNITSAAIEGYNPDILVVNERFDDTWSELGLSSKYKIIGETTNRNAIVYNSDVFEEVVKSGSKAFTVSDGVNYRNVSYAILKDGEQLIAVFATHWGTDSANHASQLADMQSCMNEVLTGEYADIPVVIAGDFNSAATATEYSKLITEGGYTNVDAATSVDHIAVKGFEVVGAGRDTKSYTKFASDHKPIYADIKIGG